MREKTVGSKNAKITICVAPSYPHPSGRMFVRMTRTRTRTYGVIDPSSRQPLLAAMLRAFCWLVSNVVSTLQTIFNRPTRAWHTDEAEDDHLPTPNDPTQKEAQTFEPSFSGKRSARIPRIPVASTRGTTPYSLCALNQDAWDKPKHDAVVVLQTRSGPSAASPAKAGVQTPHGVRTSNSSAPRTRTGPPPSRGIRLATPELAFFPLIPTKVGIQGGGQTLSHLAASILRPQHTRSWIPAPHPEPVEAHRNERLTVLMPRQFRLI